MKKNFFPVALMALAIGFNACSSDDVTVNANGGGLASFTEGGYAKVSINLPSRSNSNRANDAFEDGLASEYHVNNAKLVLFQGDSEAKATFHSAYNLNVGMDGYKDDPNQITTTTRIISRLNDASQGTNPTGKYLYALVVLNDNGLLAIDKNANGEKLTVDGKDMAGKGLAYLQTLAVASSKLNLKANGLPMTNAPLATQAGGGTIAPGGNVLTLVDFTESVYNTEAEAQKNTATDVYVERAVAKVTMNQNNGGKLLLKGTDETSDPSSDVHFIGSDGKDIKWEIVGWDLDVTNNSSYFVRNTTDDHARKGTTPWNGLKSANVTNGYRFIGSHSVKDGKSLYRTYWAEDPNYNSFDPDKFTYLPSDKTDFTETFGSDNPKYCFENTFDVDHQVKQGTTRVIVKVKLTDVTETNAVTFYTFNGDNSRLYKQGDFEKRIKDAILREPNVEAWVKKNGGSIETAPVTLTFKMKSVPDSADPTGTTTKEVYDRDAADGQIHLTDFTVKVGTKEFKKANLPSGATMSSEALAEALNLGKLVSYEGGYAYYPIRIKHFGKDDTPWNKEDKAPTTKPSKGATTAQIYPGTDPTRSNNYLGRYGVLRNNWYEISVSKISAIGSPVVPGVKTDGTPDDDFYNYIAVRINVLSWAKRTQVEEL